jgi:PKD repeat protein
LDVPKQLSAHFEILNYTSATCARDTLHFLNASCGGTLFLWDYGDGSGIDTAINPHHVYTAPGKYIVTLYAYEGNEVDSFSTLQPVNIPIQASFTYSNSEVCVGDTILFTSTSCGAEHYYWNFGDGSPLAVGSTTSHVYQYAGQYFIKLIIENAGVYDTANCFSCINVSITPAIESPDMICQDSTIQFLNPVCENTPAFWSYGDGNADSTGIHTYAQPGWYLLTQTLSSGAITASDSKWIEVLDCPLPLWYCGIFPNPTPGICNICYATPADATVYVKVTDLLGKQFNIIPLPPGIQQTEISLIDFADGIYIVKIVDAKNSITIKKFVKE